MLGRAANAFTFVFVWLDSATYGAAPTSNSKGLWQEGYLLRPQSGGLTTVGEKNLIEKNWDMVADPGRGVSLLSSPAE